MVNKVFKCVSCSKYTLKTICDKCKEKTMNPKPPRYSPLDRFGEYRRKYNEMVHKTDL